MLTVEVRDSAEQARDRHWAVATPVLAAVAAHAATGVAGVVRLQPGLAGLAGSAVRAARQWIASVDAAPTEGVRVRVDPADGGVDVELDLAIGGFDTATGVAGAVQRAVRTAVRDATGVAIRGVSVNILDADPELPA